MECISCSNFREIVHYSGAFVKTTVTTGQRVCYVFLTQMVPLDISILYSIKWTAAKKDAVEKFQKNSMVMYFDVFGIDLEVY